MYITNQNGAKAPQINNGYRKMTQLEKIIKRLEQKIRNKRETLENSRNSVMLNQATVTRLEIEHNAIQETLEDIQAIFE